MKQDFHSVISVTSVTLVKEMKVFQIKKLGQEHVESYLKKSTKVY